MATLNSCQNNSRLDVNIVLSADDDAISRSVSNIVSVQDTHRLNKKMKSEAHCSYHVSDPHPDLKLSLYLKLYV